MNRPIRVLVFCGTGMATSTIVEQEIRDIMDEEGIRGTIAKCSTSSVEEHMHNVDVVFSATMYKLPEDIKSLNVSGLISGINEDKIREDIVKLLHEVSDN